MDTLLYRAESCQGCVFARPAKATRQRLFAAAAGVFAEYGVGAATVEQLARLPLASRVARSTRTSPPRRSWRPRCSPITSITAKRSTADSRNVIVTRVTSCKRCGTTPMGGATTLCTPIRCCRSSSCSSSPEPLNCGRRWAPTCVRCDHSSATSPTPPYEHLASSRPCSPSNSARSWSPSRTGFGSTGSSTPTRHQLTRVHDVVRALQQLDTNAAPA